MLDGAFTSPKIRMLAAILQVPWPHAIGICGLLWRFAAKHAPTGAVGRHPDEEIAISLEWTGDPEILIDALVRCRLLDLSEPPERLLVHDWPQHAPRHVRATLHRLGQDWSDHYSTNDTVQTTDTTTEDTTDHTSSSSSSSSTLAAASTLSNATHAADCRLIEGESEVIWNEYVPGRKLGKRVGTEHIKQSIRKIADERDLDVFMAAKYIHGRTVRDRDRYLEQIRKGEIELKFIPQGSTYFKEERWNDGNEEIDQSRILDARIDDEIIRARNNSDMG